MSMRNAATVNIEDVVAQGAVEARLQPILSIRRRAVIGVEALSRGRGADGTIIPPDLLFTENLETDLAAELDHLCHIRAVERFLPVLAAHPAAVLFLNLLPATLDQPDQGISRIRELAQAYDIPSPNIAIEIPESEITDSAMLKLAIDECNAQGFLVALDDVGVRHANLDRILAVKPDILKIDRSLLHDIDQDSYKQDLFRSLVNLSERIGGWTIAEGIERVEQATTALELGGDMLQGYYFGMPTAFGAEDQRATAERILHAADAFKRDMILRHQLARDVHNQRRLDAQAIVEATRTVERDTYNATLLQVLPQYPTAQSACVLDAQGMQISDTVWRTEGLTTQKAVIFHPPTPGTDHSFKEYFFLLPPHDGATYETEPYVPLPTSALCVTVAARFRAQDGAMRVLCLHLDAMN